MIAETSMPAGRSTSLLQGCSIGHKGRASWVGIIGTTSFGTGLEMNNATGLGFVAQKDVTAPSSRQMTESKEVSTCLLFEWRACLALVAGKRAQDPHERE